MVDCDPTMNNWFDILYSVECTQNPSNQSPIHTQQSDYGMLIHYTVNQCKLIIRLWYVGELTNI